MALIKNGYFPDTYWPSRYWQEDYWPEYGPPLPTLMEDGYWNVRYWPSLYWQANYWPKYGTPAAPAAPTAASKQGMYPTRRRFKRRLAIRDWLDDPEILELLTIFIELD